VNVVLPTLAVVLTWLAVGALAAGCGSLARRALLRLLGAPPAGGLAAADLWIGLGALLAYLQLWSLAFRIGLAAWIAPAIAGVAGLALGVRRLRAPRPSWLAVGLAAVGVLWLANRALAVAQDYDLGLYHLNAIRYSLAFPAIPGLANLQERLGASNPHLLLVAFLGSGPWGGAAPHLANGLLVSMLLVDVASRFGPRTTPRAPSFTRRVALLLVPAAIAVAGASPTYRLSSPNLDLAAFVLVAAGALHLADSVEHGFRPAAALAATSALALAAATRPLYWPTTLLAIGFLLLAASRNGTRPWRPAAAIAVLPGALLVGFAARQAVLSGYPFFPSTVAGLPVDWRVPASVVRDQNRWVDSWARRPGLTPDQVLGSWHWLSPWLHARVDDLDVMAPLTLLAALVPSLFVPDRGRRARLLPMLAVLVPSLAAIAAWFPVAPDPRFAFAPLWLVPIALVAWALPALERPTAWLALAAGALTAAALVEVGERNLGWLFLAAFDLWLLVAVVALAAGSVRVRRLVALAALVSVALVPVGIVARGGAFDTVTANGGGTLGTPPLPVASLVGFRTSSGLQLFEPAGGADQCWGATLCAPQPSAALRLRGAGIRQGFAFATAGTGRASG
jgi:hypothetical protein